MKVKHGWSGEFKSNQWAKVDVVLEEEDLRRVFTANRLPAEASATLPTSEAFQLLEIEAEIFLVGKLARSYDYPAEAARLKITGLENRKKQMLAEIRAGLDG